METHPTAPQHTPGLCPNTKALLACGLGLWETAVAVTSFPPSFLTRKWLTHVYHAPIYQQIISPVFWDLMTGPISCELPNNVYNQLLMALCYSVITGPLVSVSAVPHLTCICAGEAAHFHSPLLPNRGEAGCVPSFLTHADVLGACVCVWDSFSK